MLDAFRFEDDDANENEFWLKVFSRILKKKKHTGEFHYFSFFTINVNMVILLIVSATIPWLLAVFFLAWMLRCRAQAERSSFSAKVNWQETAHEKSLAPRVPPLRHILAKAPSTSTWTFPERKFLTDAKSGCFFIRWRNNIELSSLPWILYSRWQPRCQVLSRPRALFYNSCSVANFSSRVLDTRVKPDTCQIRVDVETFDSGKK